MADALTKEPVETPTSAVAADMADERLIHELGVRGVMRALVNRIRGGDLGVGPVIFGLVVICIVFYAKEPTFLSSASLVSITQFAAPTGVIALGIVLVLLLGEIDLSVGSVAGFTSAVMAVTLVNNDQPLVVAMGAAIGTGLLIGLVYAVLHQVVGVPSFVFSLAGLLAFQGALLYTLGDQGTITLPQDSGLRSFAREKFLSDTQAYTLVAIATLAYLGARLWTIRKRKEAGLTPPSLAWVVAKAVLLAAGLGYFVYYLGLAPNDRGVGYLFTLFVLLVVVVDLALRKTTWGRHVMAVGGNEEAARRSGIKVSWIYVSVFGLTSTFAALGGVLLAGQLTTVSQSSGTTDTNLTAIAAAVIGGTSLFGGRGTAYAALLGMLVLQAISAGLNIINVDSDVRFMVTGGVLLVAVAIDSVSRRLRSSSGRG
ncbi:sugar ABC transporter permease [Nocardioides sp.]|uniref:sugar ABC transporter permease n=1 Tax=Nocardioides sp. TaxID=35761 RepID=UPI00271D3F89|nr:sugar ABC transporter permease [Nocardioides sp.]MDO9455285.1 sugar ABC transporter permease [Nocardioides sp.]